jgi:ERCC4-type nuclease
MQAKKKTKKQLEQEMQEVLSNIVVICDTREQENKHITKIFDRCNISHNSSCLKFADYSFFRKDTGETFDNSIVIERKNSIDELSGSLTVGRKRLEKEMQKAKDVNCRFILLIEDGSYDDILLHRYRSKLTPKSFLASLLTYQTRYNVSIIFMQNRCSANFIYNTFKYYLREKLKGEIK